MGTTRHYSNIDPFRLFGDYMKLTGVPTLSFPQIGDPRLQGKKLGIVNGSNWISLWSTWFGKQIIPEVKLVQVGNEGVQLNFMEAYHRNEPCPPQINIDLFCRYAEDLYRLYRVDAILITCSTMNRSAGSVRNTMASYGVPVVQIDEAMMEEAVLRGGESTGGGYPWPHGPKHPKPLAGNSGSLGEKDRFLRGYGGRSL